jgi:phosphoserine aminotransferase
MKPTRRPANPCFSSGPCAKRPGWSPMVLAKALVGRSHRSGLGKERLIEVIERSRTILGLPADWRVAIVAASDTGAVEMAMWSRGVDMLAWENFGAGWVADAKEMKLADLRVLEAPYGRLPDLAQVDFDRDVVFTWNGTTAGVRVPNGDWIAADRRGLVICDATSAVFAMRLPWDKLDVVTWSWQKALGGEAAHGMLALSPRAVERLLSYTPPRPLPKIFRLVANGKLNEGVFRGETINTPSMLCVEDALDSLQWAQSVGGLEGLIARSEANLAALARWVENSRWVRFLAEDPATLSCTSPCLAITDPWFLSLSREERFAISRALARRLEEEGAAYDIASHRASPPGLRIWTGATVETADVEALLPWLDWAWEEVRGAAKAA